jgi:ethanolamine utilization protein EutA
LPHPNASTRKLWPRRSAITAQTLGAVLREDLGVASELLVIDGVTLWDFDYVDLGRIRMPSYTVPVTVKSLVFSEDPRVVPGEIEYAVHHHHGPGEHHHHHHGHGGEPAHHHGGHGHDHTHGHHAGGHDHLHEGGHHGLPAALRGAPRKGRA